MFQLPVASILAASSAMDTPKDIPQTIPKSVVFASSGIGGCMGWVVIHPANTIAVRMSLASMQGQSFSLAKMGQEMGWFSVYDGLSAALLRQVVYATARFGLFEICRDYAFEIRGKTDFASRVVIGAATGGMAAYLSCPMEVAVVRMSNDKSLPTTERRNYKGVVDTATRIVKEEGIMAFWRGSNPFVARAMMVGVFQVATMDQFKDLYATLLHQTLNSIPNVFSAAMTSGLIYSLATMPLEATKNRMASQRLDPVTGKLPYTSIIQTVKTISAKEGFFALYNGFTPYYVRCGGHTVAMFIFVQMLRDAYTERC